MQAEVSYDHGPPPNATWWPTPKQYEFLECPDFEVLYGGAAGGGKTDALLVDALGKAFQCVTKRSYQAIIFRRTYPDLKDIIDRSHELYPDERPGGVPKYDKQAHVWTWPSGARIEFGHLDRDVQRFKYRGRAFQYIGWEELTLWPTEIPYRYLLSRVRSTDPAIPLLIRATTNPDGPGFQWVKERWAIPDTGKATVVQYELGDPETGEKHTRKRRFIPAKVSDNKHIGADYKLNLLELEQDDRVRLLEGKWVAPHIRGAYFSKEMELARIEDRITKVPWARGIPCCTFWDLGVNDTTAIWVGQYVRMQWRWLKTYENSGEPLSHYTQWLLSQPYTYERHFIPHDASHRKLGREDVDSPEESLKKLLPGHTFEVVPRTPDVVIGIQQTRDKMDECFYDQEGCAEGIAALENYRKEWDEENQTYKSRPLHDWTSNYADAFRQWGQGWQPIVSSPAPKVSPFESTNPGTGM